MKALLKLLKKHIVLFIVLIIILITAIIMFMIARSILLSGSEGTIYGNRLDGIEKVELKNDSLNKIIEDIKAKENVKSASQRLEGKVLHFIVDVTEAMTLDVAKSLTEPILTSLSSEAQNFYDIEIIITCSEEESKEETGEKNIYPVMGYKHRTSSEFVW